LWSRFAVKLRKSFAGGMRRLEDSLNAIIAQPDVGQMDPVEFAESVLKFKATQYQAKLLLDHADRIAVRFSRQSGKSTTIAAKAIALASMNKNKSILVVAPGLRQSMILMDRIEEHLNRMDPTTKRELIVQQQRTKITFRNGSRIWALPCNENMIRGLTAHLILADEAAFFERDEYMFNNVLLPMLATTNGTLIVSSTPWSSKSQFYEFCKGRLKDRFSQHYANWREAVASGLITQQFIDDMRNSMLPQQFTMEFEAEFVEDVDVWLPQDLIAKCVISEPLVEGRDWIYYPFEHVAVGVFFIGVDFGKHKDYSVVAAVEKKEDGLRLVHTYGFPLKRSYASVIGYVKALCDRWKTVHQVCVDQTGVGEYITEDMKNARIQNVEGVMFTEQKKEELATVLKGKMLKDEFKLPYDRALINELNVERYELTKTGRIKFSHPEGSHNDRFWATALAAYATEKEPKAEPIVAKTF